MKDPYETLGVNRSATDREIKDAFKKLARKFHPDLHPGDKEAEAKFKDISAANDLLKDRRSDGGSMRVRSMQRSGAAAGTVLSRLRRRSGLCLARCAGRICQ
jgi:DnaJ-class molecular chaperone with C-terminal Zn finger domain